MLRQDVLLPYHRFGFDLNTEFEVSIVKQIENYNVRNRIQSKIYLLVSLDCCYNIEKSFEIFDIQLR